MKMTEHMLSTHKKQCENITGKNRPVPVCSAIINTSGSPIFLKNNIGGLSDVKNFTTHAEYLSIDHLLASKRKYEKIILYISVQPCEDCLKKITDSKMIDKIFYLFENPRKTNRPYWRLEEYTSVTKYDPTTSKDKENILILAKAFYSYLKPRLRWSTSRKDKKKFKKIMEDEISKLSS